MKLDIKLALDRVIKDCSENKNFVKLPYELDIIKNNKADWVQKFENDIINDDYAIGPIQICDVPKGKHHIRPGAHLSIADSVYYAALVGEVYKSVHENTVWARNRYDFSYSLTGDFDKVKWVSDSFGEWQNFRARSLEKIRQGFDYVLVADISGFYENVNIQTLSYDLKHIGIANNVADALSKCLNHWAQNHGKGLPQGYTASNILAKLYLNSVDLRLKDDGLVHYRYVDDIRIFCKSFLDAKSALMVLTSLLRNRGLNLQTSKTKILFGKDALDYIEGVQPIIENILADLKNEEIEKVNEAERIEQEGLRMKAAKIEVNKMSDFFDSLIDTVRDSGNNLYYEEEDRKAEVLEIIPKGEIYTKPFEEDDEFVAFDIVDSKNKIENSVVNVDMKLGEDSSDPDTVDISIIRHTFDSFFIKSDKPHFDKTLFRFLLKRLGNAKDFFAVELCKDLFERHPEETSTLLKYFENINAFSEASEAIESFLLSPASIYYYQNYKIIEWMDTVREISPSDNTVSLIRKWAFDNAKPYYLRSISRKFLTRFANFSDLEMLERICIESTGVVEQAEMICVIQKMEKNRRNSTYARLGKGILNKSAIKYVKQLDSI